MTVSSAYGAIKCKGTEKGKKFSISMITFAEEFKMMSKHLSYIQINFKTTVKFYDFTSQVKKRNLRPLIV